MPRVRQTPSKLTEPPGNATMGLSTKPISSRWWRQEPKQKEARKQSPAQDAAQQPGQKGETTIGGGDLGGTCQIYRPE